MVTLLRDKNLRNFFIGALISRTGDAFSFMAFLLLLLKLSQSNTVISIFMVLHYLPGVIFGFSLGHLLDKFSKRKLLILSYIVSGASVLLALFYLKSVIILLSLSSIMGICYGIFIPLQRAYIAELAPKEIIKQANSLMQFSEVAAKTFGFLFAGILIERFGTKIAFTVDGLSFFVIAALVLLTKSRFKGVSQDESTEISSIRRNILWFFSKPTQFIPSIFFALAWFSTGAMFALEVSYAKEYLAASDATIGLLFALATVGSLYGIVKGFKKESGNYIKRIFIACLAETIFIFGYGISNHLIVAALFIIGYGLCITIRHIAITTYYHKTIPMDSHGKIFACHQALANFAMLAGMGTAGPLSTLFGTRGTILLAASTAFILILGSRGLLLKDSRSLEGSSRKTQPRQA